LKKWPQISGIDILINGITASFSGRFFIGGIIVASTYSAKL
jgi:hypothetical protein